MDNVTTHTAVEVEGWVAQMRQEMAIEPPTSNTIRTPDQIMQQLELVDSVANKALWILNKADKVRSAAKKALLLAKSKAKSTAEGKTVADREAAVAVATVDEAAELEAAQIAYRYAQGLADLVDNRKSSLQTQAKLVLATYQMAGGPRRS